MSRIIVYTGPMFSSKTAFLLAEYERSQIAERKTAAFKPAIDGRFGTDIIKSRNAVQIEAVCISNLSEIEAYDAQDYFIDEFQFLKGDIQIIQKMAGRGKNFYISGLDMTAEGKPFAIMQGFFALQMKSKSVKQFVLIAKTVMRHTLSSWEEKMKMCLWEIKNTFLFAENAGRRECVWKMQQIKLWEVYKQIFLGKVLLKS